MSAPVTMAEIDAARLSEEEVERLRQLESRFDDGFPVPTDEFRGLRARRGDAEALLRRWWAQGCREVPRG